MSTNNYESKVYLAFMEDGVMEIGLGIWLLLIGLFITFNQIAFLGVAIIPTIFIVPLKKKFTYPRIGFVKIKTNTKLQTKRLSIILSVGLIGILSSMFFILKPGIMSIKSIIFITGIVAIIMLLTDAIIMKIKRNYIYALVTAIVFFIAGMKWLEFKTILLILGGAAIFDGITMLLKFIKKYPIENIG